MAEENDRAEEVHLRLLSEQAEDALERQAITEDRLRRLQAEFLTRPERAPDKPAGWGIRMIEVVKSLSKAK